MGYVDKDVNGNDVLVEGKKDELQNSYKKIKLQLEEFQKDVLNIKSKSEEDFNAVKTKSEEDFNVLKNKSEEDFNNFKIKSSQDLKNFQDSKENIISNSLASWNESYQMIKTKIEELLPNALTAGLSFAYAEKKKSEETENQKYSFTFKMAILFLCIASLIPIFISIYSVCHEIDLKTVLERIPRLVIGILPLYIPITWVAYSSNRKMNLSKRLIEEYSHKEVLSKTFEGLSKQIANIDDKSVSDELRNKLLYTILEVNSENPGKLISDYNKSDHPLMDALDKSIKLTNAVTKLAKIPGFSKIVTKLEKKSKKLIEEENKKAEAGLDTLEENDESK